jgi:hypothetical protein
MSNYFPDGRPIQKMMHALSDNALMVVISPELTGNVLQELKEDFITTPGSYPGYTEASFNEVLSKANIMYIFSASSGWFNLSNNTNRVFVPSSTVGGMYIHGTETIRKVYVENCQVILYVKPTP